MTVCKKIVALVLAFLMILPFMVSCVENVDDKIDLSDDEETEEKKPGKDTSDETEKESQSETQSATQSEIQITNTDSSDIGIVTETKVNETLAAAPEVTISAVEEILAFANSTEVSVDFYNPIENAGYYYLVFEMYLVDESSNKEVLWKSGLVEAGKHIEKITLSRSFEIGEYDVYMDVQSYKIGTLLSNGHAQSTVKLIVIDGDGSEEIDVETLPPISSETDTAEEKITVPTWSTISIPENKTEVKVDFYNPVENSGKYYLNFKLCLVEDGDETEIYKSGLVSPGEHIRKITLSRSFEKGEYSAKMYIQPYKMGTLDATTLNNVNSLNISVTASIGSDLYGEIVLPASLGNDIHLPANQTKVNVNFYNPIENADKYSYTVKLYLLDEAGKEDVLCKSTLLQPGDSVETITLSRALEVGEYDAMLCIQPYEVYSVTPYYKINSCVKLIVSEDAEFVSSSENIKINHWKNISIAADEQKIEMDLCNSEYNEEYNCVFKLCLIEKGEEVEIYKSDAIASGEKISTVSLSKTLVAGVYDVIIYSQFYKDGSPEQITFLNSIKLYVTDFGVGAVTQKVLTPSTESGSGSSGGVNSGGVGLVVDPNLGDYQPPETSAPEPGIAIPGWGEITIPPNETDITLGFYNPIANANYYYLTFTLYLIDENGEKELLYKSPLVEPGEHIQRITLSRSFEVGEYDAFMHVQPYKMDSLTVTNNMDSKVKLKVVARS